MQSETKKKLVVPSLVAAAVLMFGFGFALVPLYDLMCDVLGINGKIQDLAITYDPSNVSIDSSRTIELRMVVVNNEAMPWEMTTSVTSIDVHPGQVYQLSYKVANPTNNSMTAQAIPSVSPGNSAQYLKKIQCFCFNNMSLEAQEESEANVVFYIDPEIPDYVHSMILSYTLFDVTDIVAVN